MNKNGLIAAVAEKCGIAKKEAAEVVEATLNIITDSLKKGEKVQIVGFGCFEVRERAEREGRNRSKDFHKRHEEKRLFCPFLHL